MRPASRREEVFAVIVRFRAECGISPTCVEIQERMSAPRVSLPMVVKYLDELERHKRLTAVYASGKRSPRSLCPVPSRQVEMWGAGGTVDGGGQQVG